MAVLTHAQLVTLWEVVGGSGLDADTAAAIAQAESGGDTTAINNTAYPNRAGYHPPAPGNLPEYSVGLWQINMLAHPSYTQASLLTQTGNANAALAISDGGSNFSAWSTYKNGSYKRFLALPGTSEPGPSFTPAQAGEPVAPKALNGWNHYVRMLAITVPTRMYRTRVTSRANLRALR